MDSKDTVDMALKIKFHDSEWVAYDAANGETEIFATLEKAESWLDECSDGGIAEETEQGYSYIAKITHRSAMEITDRKENYHQHTDSCGALTDECDEETWPYGGEYDYIGRVYMVPVTEAIDSDTFGKAIVEELRVNWGFDMETALMILNGAERRMKEK